MIALLTFRNLKLAGIAILLILAVWFYKDYSYHKSENERQTSNIEQLLKKDSLRYAEQFYNKQEFQEYLIHNRQDVLDFLDSVDIKLNRVDKILTQELNYRDNRTTSVNLKPILDAIKNEGSGVMPVKDSTRCLIIEGFVVYKNDTLSLNITDRKFKNRTDVITYWERNKWNFLGLFKTRIFGRKKATVIIKDDCGKTQTFEINTKKK